MDCRIFIICFYLFSRNDACKKEKKEKKMNNVFINNIQPSFHPQHSNKSIQHPHHEKAHHVVATKYQSSLVKQPESQVPVQRQQTPSLYEQNIQLQARILQGFLKDVQVYHDFTDMLDQTIQTHQESKKMHEDDISRKHQVSKDKKVNNNSLPQPDDVIAKSVDDIDIDKKLGSAAHGINTKKRIAKAHQKLASATRKLKVHHRVKRIRNKQKHRRVLQQVDREVSDTLDELHSSVPAFNKKNNNKPKGQAQLVSTNEMDASSATSMGTTSQFNNKHAMKYKSPVLDRGEETIPNPEQMIVHAKTTINSSGMQPPDNEEEK